MKPGHRQKETSPAYRLDDGTSLRLRSNLGEGGEGLVYATDQPNCVAKLYLPDKPADEDKLKLLVAKGRDSQGKYNLLGNFCLPRNLIYDRQGKCVGYTMRKFSGDTLAGTLLQDELTRHGWTRVQLATLGLNIIKSLRYLRLFGMLMGDINLRNILVNTDGDFAIIDTDSFQIEDRYYCDCLRYEFTSPRYIEAVKQGDRFRTVSDENYAIATLLFCILMPEKKPYMSVDGLNEVQALRRRKFVFPEGYGEVNVLACGTERMWYDLPQPIRAKFCDIFSDGADVGPEEWETLLEDYLHDLEVLNVSSVIFPRNIIMSDHLLTLPERQGTDSTPCEFKIPRRNAGDRTDFAFVYFGCDNIYGLYSNSWERTKLFSPKISARNFLKSSVFSRIDAEGKIDAAALAHDLAYSPALLDWYKFLAQLKPMVTRIYTLADSTLRNIANGKEVGRAIEKVTGWRFNIPSSNADNYLIARAVYQMMKTGWREDKFIVYVDEKVSCRLLFCQGESRPKHTVNLSDCGRRIMRNRFLYISGLDRTPEAAWEEHDSACDLLASQIEVPEGFEDAHLYVVGLSRLGNIASPGDLSEKKLKLDKDILINRHRVSDYLDDFSASAWIAEDFDCRLALPLVAAVRKHLNCRSLTVLPLEMYQIKVIMNLENITQ